MYAANMTISEELFKLRDEARRLRQKVATLEQAYQAQRKKADRLEELLRDRDKTITQLEKEQEELGKLIEELKKQRDTYRGMIYKPKVKDLPKPAGGRRTGHKGMGRTGPVLVDRFLHVFAKVCPDCNTPLKRSHTAASHTVEDIPEPETIRPIVTCYEIERQWCTSCHKEVVAIASGVIPHCRLGINLIVQVLTLHYRCRLPYKVISTFLDETWGIAVSPGALVGITRRTRDWFGSSYHDLLVQIRAAPVKHADETGWRIDGVGGWVWAFMSRDTVYYTIEQTRGKGVAKTVLAGSKNTDVLVRDDYAAYEKLEMDHQSCWAHLLRKSHEAVDRPNASREMKALHVEIKDLYGYLEIVTNRPFNLAERRHCWQQCCQQLAAISSTVNTSADAQKVQTRIRNQGTNLLTAILKENVPLTNNLAERMIRPMVVTRKISGGSRSTDGASSHAVNMSILQTILLRQQPLHSTLKDYILQGVAGKN